MQPSYRQPERIGASRFTLNAALVGAVNTAILLWDDGNAPVVEGGWPLATFCTIIDSVADGTSFKFHRAGRWQFNANFTVLSDDVEAHAVDFAVSLDSANLNNAPQVSSDTVLDFAGPVSVPIGAGFGIPAKLSCEIPITDTLAGDASRGIVRIHAADANTGGPPTGIYPTNASCYFRWLGDLRGG